MFSKPLIFNNGKLSSKAYIEFYLHGVLIREYSGERLDLPLHPNKANNLRGPAQPLTQLRSAIADALNNKTYPGQIQKIADQKKIPCLQHD